MPVPRGKAGVKKVMDEFHNRTLRSGSSTGPMVTNPMQAVAIAYREAGMPKDYARKPRGTFRKKLTPRQIDRSPHDFKI